MEVIVKGRQKGKTTELIKKSAETGYYILTENRNRAVSIADLAQEMGYKIPFPTTVFEYQRSHGFRGSYIKNIYIDDADAILKSMFSRVIIEAVTMTTQLQDDDEAEWIEVDPLGIGHKAYMCSRCKTGDWSITVHEYQYCPYCGRRMKNGGNVNGNEKNNNS